MRCAAIVIQAVIGPSSVERKAERHPEGRCRELALREVGSCRPTAGRATASSKRQRTLDSLVYFGLLLEAEIRPSQNRATWRWVARMNASF